MAFFETADKILYFLDEGILSRVSGTGGIPAMLLFAGVIFLIFFSYLLGSVNFAIIISNNKFKDDIRTHGSKNAGTTNMMRTYGKKAAVLTLLGDMAKGVLACLAGRILLGVFGCYLAGLFCIVGHIFPVFYRFRGGKGVATTAGVILVGSPLVFLIMLVIFFIIAFSTKYISLASVMGMLLYPIVLYNIEKALAHGLPFPWAWITIIYSALVIFMHRENIKRLREGKENKFSFKKRKTLKK